MFLIYSSLSSWMKFRLRPVRAYGGVRKKKKRWAGELVWFLRFIGKIVHEDRYWASQEDRTMNQKKISKEPKF